MSKNIGYVLFHCSAYIWSPWWRRGLVTAFGKPWAQKADEVIGAARLQRLRASPIKSTKPSVENLVTSKFRRKECICLTDQKSVWSCSLQQIVVSWPSYNVERPRICIQNNWRQQMLEPRTPPFYFRGIWSRILKVLKLSIAGFKNIFFSAACMSVFLDLGICLLTFRFVIWTLSLANCSFIRADHLL